MIPSQIEVLQPLEPGDAVQVGVGRDELSDSSVFKPANSFTPAAPV